MTSGCVRRLEAHVALLVAVVGVLWLKATPASSLSLILGDSYFTDRHMLPDILNKYTNGSFESAAVGGASLHEGDVPSVPDEWREMRNKTKWTSVLIDAGANDIITWKASCLTMDEQCMRVLNESAALYWDMVNDMKTVGVEHIIFLGFIPVEGLDRAFDEITYKFVAMCHLSPVPCTYIDLKEPPVALGPDKNHPTADGYADVANRTIGAIQNKTIPL